MVAGVYGLGRFGAFWASELAKKFDVVGWSRNPARRVPPGVRRVNEDELLQADVLVLCVAISALEDVLQRIAGRLKTGVLVMDTCSVKMHPARLMEEILPEHVQILATHPMFGPDSGRNGLSGLPLVFSPVRLSEENAETWRSHFRDMKLQVVEISPEEHDREASITQGITHFIGRVLGELNLRDSAISTSGYKSLLDIIRQTCNDPWRLFADLQQYNPYTAQMRRELYASIRTMQEKFDSIQDLTDGREHGGNT